jgi:hypothetical protein
MNTTKPSLEKIDKQLDVLKELRTSLATVDDLKITREIALREIANAQDQVKTIEYQLQMVEDQVAELTLKFHTLSN